MAITRKLLGLAALSNLVAPLVCAAAPLYKATPIGSIGGSSGDLTDLNNGGQIVGYALTKSNVVNAYVSSGGVSSSLQPGWASASSASGINDAGVIAGDVTSSGSTRAVTFSNGAVDTLGTLGGDSVATGINNRGDVAGTSKLEDPGIEHAFRYTKAGGIEDLGTLGGSNSVANHINSNGSVVGHSDVAGSASYHAFMYANGSMSDLGTLGGTFSSANAVNDKGLVAGFSYTAGNAYAHGFLYANGQMTDLSTLGGSNSYALGLNNLGQVVGSSEMLGGSATHAFLYANGVMTDLNSLVGPEFEFVLRYAADINEAGQIAALGCNNLGTFCQGFLLDPVNPVPEPASWAMMAMGGILVALAARRRRRPAR